MSKFREKKNLGNSLFFPIFSDIDNLKNFSGFEKIHIGYKM